MVQKADCASAWSAVLLLPAVIACNRGAPVSEDGKICIRFRIITALWKTVPGKPSAHIMGLFHPFQNSGKSCRVRKGMMNTGRLSALICFRPAEEQSLVRTGRKQHQILFGCGREFFFIRGQQKQSQSAAVGSPAAPVGPFIHPCTEAFVDTAVRQNKIQMSSGRFYEGLCHQIVV